ncbi:hypothetical protein, partial [Pseudomonas aeruginosa]|uniref:hypothetical protein n=1 Tax=Pseudomonas aeruginosa TaxID=287 RepID=UPI001C4F0AEA
DGPYGRPEIFNGAQCLVNELHGGNRAPVCIFGCEVSGATGGEFCARARGEDGVDIQAVEIAKPVTEEAGAELVYVGFGEQWNRKPT